MQGAHRWCLALIAIAVGAACGAAGEGMDPADGGGRDAGRGGARASCATNGDCAGGEVCYRARCAPPRPEGQACENGGQCQRSPRVLFCVDERCSPCADRCNGALVCDRESGDCKVRLGRPCAADGDCQSGLCCPGRLVCGQRDRCP